MMFLLLQSTISLNLISMRKYNIYVDKLIKATYKSLSRIRNPNRQDMRMKTQVRAF